MAVYRTDDGDKIKLIPYERDIIVNTPLRLTVREFQNNQGARGSLVAETPIVGFEDIFQEDIQFKIELVSANGVKKSFEGCMAVGGGPQNLEWKCGSVVDMTKS